MFYEMRKMSTYTRNQFDISPKHRKVVEENFARRKALRQQYLMEIGNPYRHGSGQGGHLFDEGMQRLISLRARSQDYFKPSPKTTLVFIGCFILPFIGIGQIIKMHHRHSEHLYRTGQVGYQDRCKFK